MLTEICIDSCINIYVDAVYQWYEIKSGRWTITKIVSSKTNYYTVGLNVQTSVPNLPSSFSV